MSIEALSAVKPRQTGNASRKAVLLVLADYADELWSCWPSQQRLADETELGVRTVRRVLAELEGAGLIYRVMRRGEGGHRSSDRIVLVQSAIRSLPARMAARAQPQPATDDTQPATDDNPNRPQEPGNSHLNGQLEQVPAEASPSAVAARSVVSAFWKASDPRPAVKFIALVKIAEAFIEAGWTEAQLMAGLRKTRAFTKDSIEFTLRAGVESTPVSNREQTMRNLAAFAEEG